MMNSLVLTITVLFTSSFRERFHVTWTSHKAQLINDRVIDQQYSFAPLSVQKWTDLFNYDKGPCRQIESMAQFDDRSDENCFFIIDNS